MAASLDWPGSLTLVGAGKMGLAMLKGWLESGLPAASVVVFEAAPSPELLSLRDATRLMLNPAVVAPPEVLVLAIKPQSFEAAAPSLAASVGPGTLVVSILAGKRIADLARGLPKAGGFVRAMPNTPAAVRRGVSGAVAEARVDERGRGLARKLLEAVGGFHWVADEAAIDAVTAISGSGPAYAFALVEAMAAAGAELGLPADLAAALARATVEGAGELMFREPSVPASKLRENVTSPGGTTAAALAVLQGPDGLKPLLERAARAAYVRAGELAG